MLKSGKVGDLTCSHNLDMSTRASSSVPAAIGLGAFRTTCLRAENLPGGNQTTILFSHPLKVCFAANSGVNLKK